MYQLFKLLLLLILSTISHLSLAQSERPNILWLVVEDMSPYLSFYGNNFTHTPTLDQLAERSIIFTNAYSNGAQCSPARSTLISGIYAPMLATDWHRQGRAVPEEFYFPKWHPTNILMGQGQYRTSSGLCRDPGQTRR